MRKISQMIIEDNLINFEQEKEWIKSTMGLICKVGNE